MPNKHLIIDCSNDFHDMFIVVDAGEGKLLDILDKIELSKRVSRQSGGNLTSITFSDYAIDCFAQHSQFYKWVDADDGRTECWEGVGWFVADEEPPCDDPDNRIRVDLCELTVTPSGGFYWVIGVKHSSSCDTKQITDSDLFKEGLMKEHE